MKTPVCDLSCLHVDPTERRGGPTVLLVVTEVRDSGVCSGHWTVVRDINDKRLRDDEDDDPGAGQSPRVGEPSSSSNRLVKRKNPQLVESEGQKQFASERRHCGRESFPWQCRRIQNQPRMTVSHDSLAGSSGDSMRWELFTSLSRQFDNSCGPQTTSRMKRQVPSHTHKDTLGDKQVSNTLQRTAAKQQNSWRL